MTTNILTPELQGYRDQIAALRREAQLLTDGLTDAQRNWSPAPDTWSIAQCLDHLNKVGSLLLPRFEAAIQKARAENLLGHGPFRYGPHERLFVRLLRPNTPLKIPVPPLYAPDKAPVTDAAPRFLALQDGLSGVLEAANGLHLAKIKVVSPASSLVRLSLGAWFAGTVVHEQYHLQQAQAVRARSSFPSV